MGVRKKGELRYLIIYLTFFLLGAAFPAGTNDFEAVQTRQEKRVKSVEDPAHALDGHEPGRRDPHLRGI